MTPHRQRTMTARSLFITVALIGGLAACGGSSDSDGAPADAPGDTAGEPSPAPTEAAPADGSDGGDVPSEAPAGPASGTLTMGDGTVYTLELSTCETSNTDATLQLPDSYDLSGTASDGAYSFYLARIGFPGDDDTEDFITTGGALEGDFLDENGENIGLLYTADMSASDIVINGAAVSGALSMRANGANDLHGATTEATVDVSC